MSFIKFLGTAGARFVMIRQLRSSGGIWLSYKGTNVIIDPGPGAIVRCNSSRPKLDPASLDGIILTHKHLDHAGDINVMIEAMTEGGFRKRGKVFLPQDALGPDGVIYSYLKGFVDEFVCLSPGNFQLGNIAFKVPVRNHHSVETYGVKFFLGDQIVSFVSDTKYFGELADLYQDSTILVLNVVFYQKREQFEHLSLEEALEIIKKVRPQKAIITHFGMTLLKEKPYELEKKLVKELGLDIKCAYDGMTQTL